MERARSPLDIQSIQVVPTLSSAPRPLPKPAFNLRQTRRLVKHIRGNNQSRLIHTAPVFQPGSGRTGGGLGRSGGGSVARRSSRYWAEKELERLDEAFLSVAGQVKEQKQAAQRWIRRQKIRMEVSTSPLSVWSFCVFASSADECACACCPGELGNEGETGFELDSRATVGR